MFLAAEVAGKQESLAEELNFEVRRPQNMPRWMKGYPSLLGHFGAQAKRGVAELLHGALGVLLVIERHWRVMLRKAFFSRILGILGLNPGRITQDDARQLCRVFGGIDFASKTIFHEFRDVSRVVEVRVTQHHCGQSTWVNRKWLPVFEPQLLHTLKESAVDHHQRLTRSQ